MSAFATVGDVFTDDEFSALGNSLLWGLGALVHWRSRIVNVVVFLSCQSVHTNGVSINMAATSLTMQRLALDLGINLLIFRCSFIFAIPICPDPAVSCVVSKHNKEDLSADMTTNVCRDDVHLPRVHNHDHMWRKRTWLRSVSLSLRVRACVCLCACSLLRARVALSARLFACSLRVLCVTNPHSCSNHLVLASAWNH